MQATAAQINVYADDPSALSSFYLRLGFEERFRFPTEGAPEHVELSIGGITIGFTSRSALVNLAGIPAPPGPPQSEIVLWCDDARELWEHACRNGAKPLSEPRIFNNRLLAGWALDPGGNRVKCVSLLKRSQS